MGFLHEVGEQR